MRRRRAAAAARRERPRRRGVCGRGSAAAAAAAVTSMLLLAARRSCLARAAAAARCCWRHPASASCPCLGRLSRRMRALYASTHVTVFVACRVRLCVRCTSSSTNTPGAACIPQQSQCCMQAGAAEPCHTAPRRTPRPLQGRARAAARTFVLMCVSSCNICVVCACWQVCACTPVYS